ncbi:MAG: 30S ribosome-binding factor RbfA [Clostridiales Family XIII bacterium]|jgi:ribosome-binding factor A|nr:30S ribosome-binding factor RbfA [Clostridiales Family XIII bacterium]
MKKSYRQGRIGEEIKKIVSEMLLYELKDPGLGNMASVTDVEVSADGAYATVYISVMGDLKADAATDEEKKAALDAFGRAKGLLRKEIGSKMKIRHAPELNFKIDASGEYGRRMERVFESLRGETED